jgi:hypothetical protein
MAGGLEAGGLDGLDRSTQGVTSGDDLGCRRPVLDAGRRGLRLGLGLGLGFSSTGHSSS